MEYEVMISDYKFTIAYDENIIIEYEQALGGRGESSIIRYH